MAATKKTTAKKASAKAKAPAKKTAAVAPRAPRKQPAAATVTLAQQEMMTLLLASVFTALCVLFAAISYWRYHL